MILAAIGGMVAFSLIAVGYLFLYYLVIFGLAYWANKNEYTARWKQYTLLLVFSLPILWLLVDPYCIGEWLMNGVKLDMK